MLDVYAGRSSGQQGVYTSTYRYAVHVCSSVVYSIQWIYHNDSYTVCHTFAHAVGYTVSSAASQFHVLCLTHVNCVL